MLEVFRTIALVVLLFIEIVCSGCSSHAVSKSRVVLRSSPPKRSNEKQSRGAIKVPLERGAGYTFAKVHLNGRDAGWFLIDTGSFATFIDKTIVGQLGLDVLTASKPAPTPSKGMVWLNRLELGEKAITDMACWTDDFSGWSSVCGFKISGIIGNDILAAQPFTIDFREDTLTLYNSQDFIAPTGPHTMPIPLRMWEGSPAILGSLEGHEDWWLVDTGSPRGLEMFWPTLALWFTPPVRSRHSYSYATVIGGVDYTEWRAKFGPVHLFGTSRKSVMVGCLTDPQEPVRTRGYTGIIGRSEMEDRRLTFDYSTRMMWVSLRSPQTAPQALSRYADADMHDLSGGTPLMLASRQGRLDLINGLLDHGADIDAMNAYGQTALMFAADVGDVRVVRLLLSRGARVDAQDSQGKTALHFAVLSISSDCVKLLLDHKADPNIANGQRPSPFADSIATGDEESFQAMIQAGADVNRVDTYRITPLGVAGEHASLKTIELLLGKGAQIRPKNALNPLVFAARGDNVENAALMIQRGANIDGRAWAGMTPLMAAAPDASPAMIRLLLSHGANPGLKSDVGKTAADYAIEGGNTSAVELLMMERVRH